MARLNKKETADFWKGKTKKEQIKKRDDELAAYLAAHLDLQSIKDAPSGSNKNQTRYESIKWKMMEKADKCKKLDKLITLKTQKS